MAGKKVKNTTTTTNNKQEIPRDDVGRDDREEGGEIFNRVYITSPRPGGGHFSSFLFIILYIIPQFQQQRQNIFVSLRYGILDTPLKNK